MKTIISNIIILVAIVFSNTVWAQISKRIIKERTIDNTTYVLEQRGNHNDLIKNKNGRFDKLVKEHKGKKSCDYSPIPDEQSLTKQLNQMVRNIFSTPRIKQICADINSNISIVCICNREGDILAVEFIGVNTSTISLKEIKALEDTILKMKIKWDVSVCPDVNYFMFNLPVRFKNYL
jgi:hypothetical protein